jgi:hypothetical protein
MESLLAKALESKLKYWLKSFTRDQFKLKGRTVELCNLGKPSIFLAIMLHVLIKIDKMMAMMPERSQELDQPIRDLDNKLTYTIKILC